MVEFNVYQTTASDTAIYDDQYKILYPALGLAGEAGEIANKVKKLIRDGPVNRPPDWREHLYICWNIDNIQTVGDSGRLNLLNTSKFNSD